MVKKCDGSESSILLLRIILKFKYFSIFSFQVKSTVVCYLNIQKDKGRLGEV